MVPGLGGGLGLLVGSQIEGRVVFERVVGSARLEYLERLDGTLERGQSGVDSGLRVLGRGRNGRAQFAFISREMRELVFWLSFKTKKIR